MKGLTFNRQTPPRRRGLSTPPSFQSESAVCFKYINNNNNTSTTELHYCCFCWVSTHWITHCWPNVVFISVYCKSLCWFQKSVWAVPKGKWSAPWESAWWYAPPWSDLVCLFQCLCHLKCYLPKSDHVYQSFSGVCRCLILFRLILLNLDLYFKLIFVHTTPYSDRHGAIWHQLQTLNWTLRATALWDFQIFHTKFFDQSCCMKGTSRHNPK